MTEEGEPCEEPSSAEPSLADTANPSEGRGRARLLPSQILGDRTKADSVTAFDDPSIKSYDADVEPSSPAERAPRGFGCALDRVHGAL